MSIQYSQNDELQYHKHSGEVTGLAQADGAANASWWHTQSAGEGAKVIPNRAALDDLVWDVAQDYEFCHNVALYDLYHETFVKSFGKEWLELNSHAAGVQHIDNGVVRGGPLDTVTFKTNGGRKFTYNRGVK